MNTTVFSIPLVGKEHAGAYVRADEARARITELETYVENAYKCHVCDALRDRCELTKRITELETRLAIKADAHAASMLVIAELEKQLSRYQGGVEVLFKVTGVLWNETLWFLPEISVPVDWKDKNVRVIVLPEERIVGSNKTMEVE